MGHLTLVRHGQASFFGTDYDELSPQGVAQGRALGEHWVRHGVAFDVAYVGPRRRHRQTLDAVVSAYRDHGLPWPEVVEVAELDEHDGLAVMRHVLRESGRVHEDRPDSDPGGEQRERMLRQFFRHYLEIMGDWSRGTVVVPGVEDWAGFRARTLRALDAMCGRDGHGVAFTSGGVVSSAAGWLLGLDDERVIELSAVVRNTALTEIRHSAQRRGLVSFNAVPHLPDARTITAV